MRYVRGLAAFLCLAFRVIPDDGAPEIAVPRDRLGDISEMSSTPFPARAPIPRPAGGIEGPAT
jgi:hypothetical protein